METESDRILIDDPMELFTESGKVKVSYLSCDGQEGLLVVGEKEHASSLPVRFQSSCVFSEALRAINCDCAAQLQESLRIIATEGGIVVYVFEEGRGAGLRKKMEAIRIQQDSGVDTATAFQRLGLPPDPRSFDMASRVLARLVDKGDPIALLTNNPMKVAALTAKGFTKVERRRLIVDRGALVADYLQEKRVALGHDIDE